jgi:predicted DNA-binding transcriptional regulator AlpA
MAAPKMITFGQGLDLLGISPATYYRHPQNLPRAFRVGGRLRFVEAHVTDWILAQQAAAAGAQQGEPAEADGSPREAA